ncbi:cyclase family protein [Paremcibacter congregatus]|uniref:cyclase family protein n=1 Tax=Paremcibacter congregatus TaxID=2043170 RepID=UPI0030ECD334|tara:strand:- start:116 stop:781 length:666 start_codon:yes stop_codon:yes gene_type:complete
MKTETLIDVSHVVEHGMITYKGLPAPIICDFLSREASKEIYADGTSFQIGRIDMVANTGTYMDAPAHRFADGKDLSELDLSSVANLDGLVVAVGPETREITPDHFNGLDLRGKAVLIRTDWSRHWATDQYFEDFPFVTEAAAEYLRDQGVALVGIDSHNIDDTRQNTRPAHTILLGADILIVEHMTGLKALPDTGFKFFAVPVKVKGMGTFPVRAFGLVAD